MPFDIKGSPDLKRIVVLNPKGGSGKTTLAFNLAGYLAAQGRSVALVDMDPQGSSSRWLSNRSGDLPFILGVTHSAVTSRRNGSRMLRLPDDVDCAVIDAPAGLPAGELADYTRGAHAILVPVLPSDLDIHAASRLVSDLLLVAGVSRSSGRLGIVANRVNERTVAYRQLMRFLDRLRIKVVGVLRDSQNYTWAAQSGRCIHELPRSRVVKDLGQWAFVTQWLERRLATPLSKRDWLTPADFRAKPLWQRPAIAWPAAAAAGGALVALAMLLREAPLPEPTVDTAPPADAVALVEPEPAEAPLRSPDAAAGGEPPVLLGAAEKMRQKWRLDGVVRTGATQVAILKNREGDETQHVMPGDKVDGWTVSSTGPDRAVLSLRGEEVTLGLADEPEPR